MAVSYRYPVLVWKTQEGWYTASLLEWDAPAGVGRSADAAVEQVRDHLNWVAEKQFSLSEPDFLDPSLFQVKVPIRPEYQFESRRYACDESLLLRFWCVSGRQEHGMRVCVLPTLGLRYYFHDDNNLRPLIIHYVQQRLEGVTPQDLARYLIPEEAKLDDVVVVMSKRPPRRAVWEPEIPTLQQIAEAVGDPSFRKLLARPWHRDKEVDDLIHRLNQERANVLLVGDPGCGKTTVLVEAVRRIERQAAESEDAPHHARSARLFWLTGGQRIIAGMRYLGQWEERCEVLIAELAYLGGTLCVDNLLDLIREGGTSPTDSIAAFFLPYLQRGELRLIGEATPAELDACRRLLPGFADVFQVLKLEPFGRSECISVLEHLADSLKQNHPIEVGRGVPEMVHHLHRRFLPYHAFPGRAAAFLSQLFERIRQKERATRNHVVEITVTHVIDEFIRQTGLPELFLRDELPLHREEVEEEFRLRIIGQDEAVRTAAALTTTFKAGMNDPHRPIGVLLFCGPTGVGKTETAKALAHFFFGHGEGDRLIRLDMSEYTGFGAAERLLAQPGGKPSELIRKLRQQPFVVLLLDESEKADPAVFDLLLGVFDEGRLTDHYGRLTTFRSAVIVLTSNLGASKGEGFGFGPKQSIAYAGEAMSFFRPEFFNRLDGIVTFQPLGPETIRAIARKELDAVASREGIARLNLKLTWSDALVDHLAREGFDARYGARPLQRTMETLVVVPLAKHLLANPSLRDTGLHVDLDEHGGVMFVAVAG